MDGYTSKLTKVMFLRIINKIPTLPISVVEGDENCVVSVVEIDSSKI
jgi:hypothetical protein